MGQWFYKICLVVLIWSIQTANIELSFGIAAFVTLASFRTKLSSQALLLIIILFFLVIIGSISVFSPENDYYFFLKDLIYFTRPILVILAGYFLTMRFKNKMSFLNIIVLMGFYFAFVHALSFIIYFNIIPGHTSGIRNIFGRYNHVETAALLLIICVKDLPVKRSRYKFFYQAFVACLVLSFLLYMSRTMIMVVFVGSLAYYGYLKLNRKGTIALVSFMIVGAGFALFLQAYDPPTENPGVVDGLLLKIKNSVNESFSLGNINVQDLDRRELWKHWRAYEAFKVYQEIEAEKLWVTGQGFGSTVDIGFEARLDGELTQHLSLTHNGFAYLFLKTGVLGLLIYFVMILYLYSFSYSPRRGTMADIGNNLLVATTFYILITSFVVTGIFKPYDMATLLIGAAFALKQLKPSEDSDTGDQRDT
ncbi:MAG: hypothetical protein KJO05_08175 [Bacteroidia bacterium]|nr:hypothetical protein [Bacteroidia bacterium]NNF31517.1 hypothetical protein [Flavobacteriaceae bacterium]MBT8275592.1 hypothetical protein [Bacteroidia bacterium]NNJ82782.1 hypothetical protein [Flavobacteriaceae bacterium]NNK54096.1 hypothetical protein [Flavobacteriaceae bacterium]